MRPNLTARLFLCGAGIVFTTCTPTSESADAPIAGRSDERATSAETPSNAARPTKTPEADAPSPTPAPEARDETSSYKPNAPVPDEAPTLARSLEIVHAELDTQVRAWLRAGGDLTSNRLSRIELAALFQQRIYRRLVRDAGLARRVIARLDGSVATTARTNVEAGRRLSAGLDPVKPPIRLRTKVPAPPNQLLSYYRLGERRFGVPWTVLASVNFVETRFGRVIGPSSAGALGPMQFLPSTWERYGGGGDIFNPRDAILGAARYLRASGASTDIRGALYAYNRSDDYVESVLDYAREMRRRRLAFYEYYFWQVFVRTTKGDVQLTGPGADAP